MPIMKPNQAKRKLAAGSLHYENETQRKLEQNDQKVENNMSVDTLIDPEDYEAGSTYYPNETTMKPAVPTKRKLKANVDADGNEGGSSLNPGSTNVGTIDNLVDPDQGYIGASEDDEPDFDVDEDDNDPDISNPAEDPNLFTGDDEDDGSVEASETDLMNNDAVTPLETNEDDMDDLPVVASDDAEEDDWDSAPADEDEVDIDELVDEDLEDGQGVSIEDVADQAEPEEQAASEEDLSILDIDETPDDAVADVAFATAGTRLLVIKAHRIIATMTGRMAVASGRNKMYLTDQFQQVAAMEIEAKGLRKGLKSMGFALAKVNVGKQSVLSARVKTEVHKTTAAVRRVQGEQKKAFEQSLAIASVGINRNMFKGQTNELRAALAGEFRLIGIRGGEKILARVFAEHGPAYAKQVMELATKISAMPEQVRDGYVEALDLNTGVMDEPDEDMVPIGSDVSAGEDDEDDLEDDFGTTIEASLARPATRIKASAAANGKFSVTANQILNGSRPLFG